MKNVIKRLCGKTLTRLLSGDREAGNLEEFFEMVKERGENRIMAQLIKECHWCYDIDGDREEKTSIDGLCYTSNTLKFIEGYLVEEKNLIKRMEEYSKLFPEVKITLLYPKTIDKRDDSSSSDRTFY